MTKQHISFSEFKIWNECPWKHKLIYIDDKAGFEGNLYTAFGTAIHAACENILKGVKTDFSVFFDKEFLKEIKLLPESVEIDKKMVISMRKEGKTLVHSVLPAVKEYFGDFELISTEEKLYEPIKNFSDEEKNFKGFIDLVVKTNDGKYHVIDWKTCSWGWDWKKKNDKILSYQLTFYKYFYALKHDIDFDKIETHFALLKRRPSKKCNNPVEIFKITSDSEKTKIAVKSLVTSLQNITKKNYIKNRLACKNQYGYCEFYNTENCPR